MAPQTIRVLIADDHSVFLDGLKMLLEKDPELEIVAAVENGRELIGKAMELEPDVIVTDIRMPGIDGIEAIKKINESKAIPCIALSTYDSDTLIMEALKAGASGYILKNAQRGEIVKAIKSVINFHPYYCKATEAVILKMISKSIATAPLGQANIQFSEREIEIIKLVCMEVSSTEISKKLFLSKRTVDATRAKLLTKMNVKSSAGIILYALKHGLLNLDEIEVGDVPIVRVARDAQED